MYFRECNLNSISKVNVLFVFFTDTIQITASTGILKIKMFQSAIRKHKGVKM